MDTRRDYTEDAESLFRRFAARHAFTIEKVDDPPIELLMRVPSQRGLSFDLTLGLQNRDELNLGFQNFWSVVFPFEKVSDKFEAMLDGLVHGNCRLATRSQLGNVIVRRLERRTDMGWEAEYHEFVFPLKIPLVPVQTSYFCNGDVVVK